MSSFEFIFQIHVWRISWILHQHGMDSWHYCCSGYSWSFNAAAAAAAAVAAVMAWMLWIIWIHWSYYDFHRWEVVCFVWFDHHYWITHFSSFSIDIATARTWIHRWSRLCLFFSSFLNMTILWILMKNCTSLDIIMLCYSSWIPNYYSLHSALPLLCCYSNVIYPHSLHWMHIMASTISFTRFLVLLLVYLVFLDPFAEDTPSDTAISLEVMSRNVKQFQVRYSWNAASSGEIQRRIHYWNGYYDCYCYCCYSRTGH